MEPLDSIRRLRFYLEHVRLSSWLTFCFIAFAFGTTIGFEIGRGFLVLLFLFFPSFLVFLILRKRKVFRFIVLVVLFSLGGMVRAVIALPVPHLDQWSTFDGIVSAFPIKQSENEYQYRISVLDSPIRVSMVSSTRVEYGDKVRVSCRLVSLEDHDNFFYWQLRARDVKATCEGGAFLEAQTSRANGFYALLAFMKNTARNLIQKALPEPESSLGLGILLGERGERRSDLNTVMRRVGLSHISVVSGYNVLIVAQGVFLFFFVFGWKRLYAFVGSVFVLILFTLFIGLDASVLRAVLMFMALQIAYFLGRPRLGFYTISLTAFVMLLVNPFLIRTVGFLLSFASVAGLSLATGFWDEVCKKFPDQIKPFIVSTLAAQTGVLPVIVWYFGSISVVSLLVNVIVLPFIPIAMGAVFGVIILTFFGVPIAGWIAYPFLTTIVHVSQWFSLLPFALFSIKGQWGRVIMLLFLSTVYIMMSTRNRWFPTIMGRFQKEKEVVDKEEPFQQLLL